MVLYAIVLICLFTTNFSPGIAGECSPGLNNTYPVCSPQFHNITVPEDMKKKVNVQQINCTDAEGTQLSWTITSGNIQNFFAISQSGMVKTRKRLNAEGKANPYLLYIEASDAGSPRLTSTVVMTVFMTSVNDEPPLMLNLPHELHVPENSPRGTILAGCTLQDADSARLPVGLARVEITEGNEDDLFLLDARTCALTLNKRLDYETMSPRRLLYRAYELDTAAPLTTEQNVTINIADYNDHPPVCSDYTITLTIAEDTMPGTVVTSLNCTDIDVSDELHYALAAGTSDKLAVDPDTGEVTVAKTTDFESDVTVYDVTVHVYDVSSDPQTATVQINVQITDADDNAPYFDHGIVNIDVPETYELGRVVWSLNATDDDSPNTPMSTVTYTLLSATGGYFSLHPQTGLILVSRLLDRESQDNVLLTVSAHSSNRTAATATSVLNITIVDVNDNRPVFDQALFTGRVNEAAAVGTVVCNVTASDADEGANGDVTFSTDSAVFSIDPHTGVITVVGPLDYEKHTSYTFVVTAVDDATVSDTSQALTSEALVRVEVEGVNEASPVWNVPAADGEVRYVAENSRPGASLFTVSASDADRGEDGHITYSLLKPDLSPFLLHSQQGDVTLRSTLDRESQDSYILVLESLDSSSTDPKSSTVTLTVSVTDFNDNAPVCVHMAPVLVASDTAIGDTLLVLNCSDVDLTNGPITFRKVSGDASGIFQINSNTGEVTLFRIPIESQYELQVEVRDGGVPEYNTFMTVNFVIEDSFTFYNLTEVVEIAEDTEVGIVILNVDTVGASLPSFFEIQNDESMFAVQPSTGEVFLTSSVDRETRDTYQMTVIAFTATGHTATSTVTVSVLDVNDNAPVISGTFNISVSEDLTVPHVLHVFSAQDDDLQENGTVTFSIAAGNAAGQFNMDADGTLSIVSPLNAESSQLHDLVIVAEDGGSPALRTEKHVLIVVRDVDEFQPDFLTAGQNLQFTIPENTALGAPILHVTGDDGDLHDEVKYDIDSGNHDGAFVMDRDAGRLYLATVLDRETRPGFELVVRVTNSKQENRSSTVSLTIEDVNDIAPIFSAPQYVYEVVDNTQPATFVGEIAASDSDVGVNAEFDLEIVNGNIDHAFVFDGLILKTNKTVDISGVRTYTLTVRATDRGLPPLSSDTVVHITVTPENKPPMFASDTANITIVENSLTGTQVYDFEATVEGATEGESGDIVYTVTSGNDQDCFYLDRYTGQLYLTGNLDYETDQSHTLSILAEHRSDVTLFDVMTFAVYVNNVNDERSTFWKDYDWSVQEGLHTLTSVGTVTAVDQDSGTFGEIAYSLFGDARFSIDRTTGEVFLTGQLSFSHNSYFSLSVIAVDNAGAASLTGTAAVTVHVRDVNDHVPSFPQGEQEVSVSEISEVGSPVIVLLPQDGDHGDNGNVTCHLAGGNQAGKFDLDPDSRVLTMVDTLDAESQNLFLLRVTATDQGQPALTGTTSLTVHVTDNNDNTPVFDVDKVQLQVSRSDSPGTEFESARASDADSGQNAQIVYGLQTGTTDGYFVVDPESARLRTVTALTAAADTYTLFLTATDRGYPARTGTLTVNINVYPALLTPPGTQIFNVPENSPVETVVGSLPPDPNTAVVSRSIRTGNFRDAFSVTTDAAGNGLIKVAGSLDRETYPEYQLGVETKLADGSNDTVVVVVQVSDVNDHTPQFSSPTFKFPVVENLSAGNTVANLQITDADEGANAAVTLSFAPATQFCGTYFNLHSDGAVTIQQPIDFEVLRELSCEVVAADNGSPALTSSAAFTVIVVDVQEEEVKVFGKGTTVFRSLEIPFDSSAGRLVHAFSAEDFGLGLSPDDTVAYLSLSDDGVFAVTPATGEVTLGRQDLLYDRSRYFQWVVCRQDGSSQDTQLGMLRVDTFSMDRHVVVVSYAITYEYLESQRSVVQARLQMFFGSGTRLEVLEVRDLTVTTGRRRLLDQKSVVLVYVVADRSVDTVGGVDKVKTFLTQDDLLQALQQSSDGTPVSGVSDATLPVLQVMPYRNFLEPQSQDLPDTEEGMAVIVALIVLAGIIGVVFFVCCLWKLHREKKRRHLMSREFLFGSGSTHGSEKTGKDQDKMVMVSTISGSDDAQTVTDRVTSADIKRDLDSLLPLPLLLTKQLQSQTPPAATGMKPLPERQAALNQLIRQQKKDKKRKPQRTKRTSKPVIACPRSETRLVPGQAAGGDDGRRTAKAKPAGSAVLNQSERTRKTGQISTTFRESSKGKSMATSVAGNQTPVLTVRSLHHSSGGGSATANGKHGHGVDDDGTPAEWLDAGTDVSKKGETTKTRKRSFFSCIFAASDMKQRVKTAENGKRASMPVAVSDSQKQRIEALIADKNKNGGQTRKTSFDRPAVAKEDVVNLGQGVVRRRLELSECVPEIRRQSLFV